MKRFLKVLLPLLVLALGVCGAALLIHFRKEVKPLPTAARPPQVDVVLVQRTNHQFVVATQGTVEPRTEIQLAVEVTGRVEAVAPSFDVGGFFEKDEVLVTIDSRDFELALVQAEARVEQARYQLELEEASAEVARLEWEELGEGQANRLLLREPQLAQARAALAAAEAAVEQARRDLDRCQVRAPFAGRVGTKLVDVGQYVTRGNPLARLYAVDYAEVRLPLSLEDLAFVDLPLDYRGETRSSRGPAVRLRASLAGRPHVWEGYIDRVEGEIDPRTRMIFAVARVPDPYSRGKAQTERPPLAAGLFVDADIIGFEATNVVVLPRRTLRGRETVLVVNEANRLQSRAVEVWRTGRDQVILRDGLVDGERVCLSGVDIFVEGMEVRAESGPPVESEGGVAAGSTREERP